MSTASKTFLLPEFPLQGLGQALVQRRGGGRVTGQPESGRSKPGRFFVIRRTVMPAPLVANRLPDRKSGLPPAGHGLAPQPAANAIARRHPQFTWGELNGGRIGLIG